MSEKQKRHFARIAMKLLKRELLLYKQLRESGFSLYPNPDRLPA